MNEEQEQKNLNPIPNPSIILTNSVSLQLEILYHFFLSLSSPIFTLLSLASESFHRAEEAKDSIDATVSAAASAIPSAAAHGGATLLRRLAYGLLCAAYMGLALVVAMVVAVVVGVAAVQLWVEEPVFVRERLDFDYSLDNPTAVFYFGGGGGGFEGYGEKKLGGIPVGHTFYVSLVLLMPESDFNREIGMFQLTAELISINSKVMAKSSHPCMLRFRSLPIRMGRTFLMSIPLLLGITSETQKITIPLLKYKEGYQPRTKAIRITLLPRAKTLFLPELYEAEILLNSELPWSKEIVYRWRWTFYVWASLYIYIMIVVALFCFFRPLVFQVTAGSSPGDESTSPKASGELPERSREERSREISESLRRWQQSRSKRKAILMRGVLGTTSAGSSASTTTVTRDDVSASTSMEGVGDSESVSFRG